MEHLPEKLDFEGANNFRDLGGYPLADGRQVRRGKLYRSDHLARLTNGDQQLLQEIGIRTVVDLRRAEERDENCDSIDDSSIRQVWLPVEAKGADVISIRRALERSQVSAEDAQAFLMEANRHFATVLSPVFGNFLHMLLDDSVYPLVFHCSAGKDRVGFAAALTLYALGANDETVMHDYLATNHCTANYVDGIIDGLADLEIKVEPEAVRHLMQVVPEYLGEALGVIHDQHGGVVPYLDNHLGFGGAEREQLGSLLSESAQ